MAAAAMKILVTGSNGLIGSEAVEHFAGQGHIVHGIDNNMRADFFGPGGTHPGGNDSCKLCAIFSTMRSTSATVPRSSICSHNSASPR